MLYDLIKRDRVIIVHFIHPARTSFSNSCVTSFPETQVYQQILFENQLLSLRGIFIEYIYKKIGLSNKT